MRIQSIFPVVLALILFISCEKDNLLVNSDSLAQHQLKSNQINNSNHLKIAVISDIHYMDPSLLQNNAQYSPKFQSDRMTRHYVLVEFSTSIFNKVISEILAEKPDIVLIPGDLAKEGEAVSHLDVVAQLQLLKSAGIKVYVVPGHSDINNNYPVAYNGITFSYVPTISSLQFASLYSDFGYNDAIFKDDNSLSYIAEPYPGLWILALDAAKYSPTYAKGGRIKSETMQWIKEHMAQARQNNYVVLGLMHHNVMPHSDVESQIFPTMLLDDWKARADSLISYGLQVMFTGSAHSTDITMLETAGKRLYDIETGSLVTPPSSYRLCFLKNKELEVITKYITSISATLPNNQNFTDYSLQDFSERLDIYFHDLFIPKYGGSLPENIVTYMTPLLRNAFMAYIAGDERLSPSEQTKIDSLNYITPKPDNIIWGVTSLWKDLNTKDQKWHVKLMDYN
ncbi:MAG: metallophosphoesterase [Bacteroidota bacterium]|nr:metallophosphoesterase [Bacteroidota bacterium]